MYKNHQEPLPISDDYHLPPDLLHNWWLLAEALRALVMSVVDTTRQLLWALILLGLVQYSFGHPAVG